MAGFLTDAELAQIRQDASIVFDTFTEGSSIVVHKEPIKTLVTPTPSDNLFGFGEAQSSETYTYTPVTGVFPGMVLYRNVQNNANLNAELNAYAPNWPVALKVRKDCRDFIYNGKTEKICSEGKTFVIVGSDSTQMMLSPEFYMIHVQQTA